MNEQNKDQMADEHNGDSNNGRGVSSFADAGEWLRQHRIEDIECICADIAGVARGKLMPCNKFLQSQVNTLPRSVFMQTITGHYPDIEDVSGFYDNDGDVTMQPDLSTISVVPWFDEPTAVIINDIYERDGTPFDISPRNLLRDIVNLYKKQGWQPIVAPEIEFYLVKPNIDPDYPLEPPIGRSGRPESGRQLYSISGANEYDKVVDDIYDFSEAQGLEIDTLIHEEGAAQLEINLRHGSPLELADQVFLFKRTIREAAFRHNVYATFMAKPIANEPGNALHIHQSIVDVETGKNIFTGSDGEPTSDFFHFIGGQQAYLPAAMPFLAPYVNSYRRLHINSSAPINIEWGIDNRTTGLRVPISSPEARRVENRIPSSDTNPYLVIAASLAAGYIGLMKQIKPRDSVNGSAHNMEFSLPRGLLEALKLLENSEPLIQTLGENFVATYVAIKQVEFETFMEVISPWEREYLLLNV